jgi:hypothetical protein
MQLTSVYVPISVDEREALRNLAKSERRDPREYIRFLINQALEQRGFLSANSNNRTSVSEAMSAVVAPNL